MQLKKINSNLQLALIESGLTEANPVQTDSYAVIKSGMDVVLQSEPGSGKTTTLVLHVIQRLAEPVGLSPRALIVCDSKEKVLELNEYFQTLNKYNALRIFYVHDKTDLDEDKNQISVGIDVLIGTPIRLTEMFGGAGFDVNQLKMFLVDDVDVVLKNRHEPRLVRLTDSLPKCQKLFFCSNITERVEIVADRMMTEPIFMEQE